MSEMICARKRNAAPSKFSILMYWLDQRQYNFVVDVWEPSCFACGRWFEGRHDPKVRCDDKTRASLLEKFPLEKAHIIPHSLGGTNDRSNYVLLCKDCHRRAPMFPHRDMFLKWVASQKHYLLVDFEEFKSACECVDLDLSSLDRGAFDDVIKDLVESEMCALHGDPILGPRIPRSTFALHIKNYVERMGSEGG